MSKQGECFHEAYVDSRRGVCGIELAGPRRVRRLPSRDTAVKPLGDAYYFYAAKTYGNHAADHVLLLRQFVAASRFMPIDWVEQHIGAVRSNVASTGWAYSQLSPRITDDPAGAEQLSRNPSSSTPKCSRFAIGSMRLWPNPGSIWPPFPARSTSCSRR